MDLSILTWGVSIAVFLVVAFLLFWKFWFLRDPERTIPDGGVIVAPADGKIIKIVDLDNVNKINIKKGLIGKIKTLCSDVSSSCYLISIYMNPLNVHIQRASQSGKVLSVKHVNGKMGITKSFKNGLLNEKTEALIKNEKIGNFKIIQIAGFLVNRIENWLTINQSVVKGQKIGLINFGSQVSLIIPKNKVKLTVKQGDKVYSGSTIVAKVK